MIDFGTRHRFVVKLQQIAGVIFVFPFVTSHIIFLPRILSCWRRRIFIQCNVLGNVILFTFSPVLVGQATDRVREMAFV